MTIIYDSIYEYFDKFDEPDWYSEAVRYLRGGNDRGVFGLYLYHLIQNKPDITTVINIGTARGHSAVCAAKALDDTGRVGEVHTIDIIPPNNPRQWGTNSDSDPVADSDEDWSMREFISRFHDPSNSDVPIVFHTGESSNVLADIDITPDLVFHDGKHTYETVKTDMELVTSLSDGSLIQVHDDCHLFEIEKEFYLHNPMNGSTIGNLPLVRRTQIADDIKRYQYAITKRKFPGVNRAVEEYLQRYKCEQAEVIRDEDHAPITVVWE